MSKPKTTNSTSRVMDIRQLIAAPLIATVDADALSTKKYLNHLFSLAFELDKDTGKPMGNLRYVRFNYQDGEKEKTISLPLMSLVPLPLLQVKEAEFNFDINIVDAVTTEAEQSFQFSSLKKDSPDKSEPEFGLRATLASQSQSTNSKNKESSNMTANMQVKVVMKQADMPGGLLNLLQLMNNSIQINDNNHD